MKIRKGGLATPPPFRSTSWSVNASGITATYGRAPNYSGYQFRINKGPWLASSAWTTLVTPGTYIIQIRPIVSEVMPGAKSDKKSVVVS